MGRVAQILKAILVGPTGGMFTHHDIFDRYCAVWGTHTDHFAEHARRLGKVVKRQATHHHVKLAIYKRQA